MKLTPVEQEKLLIFAAGELAKQRKARGVLLNYPEVTLISPALLWKAHVMGRE